MAHNPINPTSILRALIADVNGYDEGLDGDERAPTGDDYNEIVGIIRSYQLQLERLTQEVRT